MTREAKGKATHKTSSDFGVSATLTSKLASIVVHADEMMSSDGHYYDKIALTQAINDPEVAEWIQSLGPLAPVKRVQELK